MTAGFSGKTAIVTGGTRGIGRSIASLLLQAGGQVIYTGTKEQCSAHLDGARYERLDLLDTGSIDRFVGAVIEREPSIDILVNNAGINIVEPVDEIRDEHWAQVISVNLTGSMRMIRAVARSMKRGARGGRILNVSSILGVVSRRGRSAYSASKTALIGLTRSSALDLAPFDILVNSLCPGFTDTELTRRILTEEERAAIAADIPLSRFADVSEIAKAAVFLCSDLNTYITGQTLVVDGGFTIA